MAGKKEGRVKVLGSEKQKPKRGKRLAAVDPDERFEVTVRVRRRTALGAQKGLVDRDTFRERFGADPTDLRRIEEFAHRYELDVVQSSASQRMVRLSGTAQQMK